jgi:hypothetical protein
MNMTGKGMNTVRARWEPSVLGKTLRTSAAILLALVFCVSCRTNKPLPTADFSQPGWRVLEGQAIWKPAGDHPEMAGDLLVATNVNGNYFLQLTKFPFPLVTTINMDDQWQIEFGAEEHSWRGRGNPPERFVWFQLPGALLGEKPAGNWHFENLGTNSWRLENPQSGESLEGGFFP